MMGIIGLVIGIFVTALYFASFPARALKLNLKLKRQSAPKPPTVPPTA